MSGHPDRETLQAFLRSGLPAEQTRAVLRHLASGCRRCQEAMEPYATAMFQPGLQEEPELTPELDAAYDAAIASACTRILSQHNELIARQELARKVSTLLRGAPLPESPGFWTVDLLEALLEKSRELRYDDPEGMLRLARLAQQAADRLDPAAHGVPETFELRARAWAELANAWRVQGNLPQAGEAMARALELGQEGTGSPVFRARLAELRASLLCDQRRFPEAFRLLDEAHALYLGMNDAHHAGRVLIIKGLYTGYRGDPGQSLPFLAEGLAGIDRERDPRLVFHALHNTLLFRVELGQLEEAQRQIQRMRPLYARASSNERTRLRIIEGKIAAGLGDLAQAEQLFVETRRSVDAAGLGYLAALVSLELAAVWLRQGRRDEARGLVAELVTVFRSIGVEREAMAALALLGEAASKDQSTLELLALISGALRQLHGGPGLLAGPEPA